MRNGYVKVAVPEFREAHRFGRKAPIDPRLKIARCKHSLLRTNAWAERDAARALRSVLRMIDGATQVSQCPE